MSSMQGLIKKLKLLKEEVVKWENNKKNENVKVLADIEDKIAERDRWVDGDLFSVDRKYELLELEGKRARILLQVEST